MSSKTEWLACWCTRLAGKLELNPGFHTTWGQHGGRDHVVHFPKWNTTEGVCEAGEQKVTVLISMPYVRAKSLWVSNSGGRV